MAGFEEFDEDRAVRFVLEGRLDSAGTEEIEARLTDCARRGSNNVILDLAKVPFVGSLGIRMLVSLGRTLQRQGRTVVLIGVQPLVQDVFETVALGEMIPIATNPAEAAQLLAG